MHAVLLGSDDDVPGNLDMGVQFLELGGNASQSGLITINQAHQSISNFKGPKRGKKTSNYGFPNASTDASTAVDINILQAIIYLRFTDSICRKTVPPLFSFIFIPVASDALTGYI